MWSIGVILFMLYFGKMPFANEELKKRLNIPNLDSYIDRHFSLARFNKLFSVPHIPTGMLNMLKGLLTINPENRGSCEECLNSDWFNGYDTSVHDDCFRVWEEDRDECEEVDKDEDKDGSSYPSIDIH